MSGKMGKETLILRKIIREIEVELKIKNKSFRELRSKKSCVEYLVSLIKNEDIHSGLYSESYIEKIKILEDELINKQNMRNSEINNLERKFTKKYHDIEVENEFILLILKNLSFWKRIFNYKKIFDDLI
ncbi:MAG: hypothetical protein ACRC6K_03755 [Fusobacteriaceae bacterium]